MEFIIDMGLLVMVIVAMSEALKQVDALPTKYIPAFNVLMGVTGGIIYLDGDIKNNVLMGVIMGLSASGLFDMKKVFEK